MCRTRFFPEHGKDPCAPADCDPVTQPAGIVLRHQYVRTDRRMFQKLHEGRMHPAHGIFVHLLTEIEISILGGIQLEGFQIRRSHDGKNGRNPGGGIFHFGKIPFRGMEIASDGRKFVRGIPCVKRRKMTVFSIGNFHNDATVSGPPRQIHRDFTRTAFLAVS